MIDKLVSQNNFHIGTSGKGRNKLRMYKLLKNNFNVELYCKIIMPSSHRAMFSKFRCDVAPTGRYEDLAIHMRFKCPFCNVVEKELHIILKWCMYDDLRGTLYVKALECTYHFNSMSDIFIFQSRVGPLLYVNNVVLYLLSHLFEPICKYQTQTVSFIVLIVSHTSHLNCNFTFNTEIEKCMLYV